MATKQITTPLPFARMFYGDNGIHEFWEDEKNESCVIRNHGEKWWICVRLDGRNAPPDTVRMKKNAKTGALLRTTSALAAKTVTSLFKRIESQYSIRLFPDHTFQWRGKTPKMRLAPIEAIRPRRKVVS